MTIREIAKLANVSPATVSNVLNGKSGKVSKENMQKILAIMEQTNYKKKKNVRIKNDKISTRIIAGIVLNCSNENFLEDPFHSQFFGEVIRVIQACGYYLMLISVEEYEKVMEVLQYWKVDGAIIVGAPDSVIQQLNEQIPMPIVFTDSYSPAGNISKVGIDDLGGGQLAARHLLELGHKSVAILSYWYSEDITGPFSERVCGFTEEYLQNNIRILNKNLFLTGNENDPSFLRVAEEIYDRLHEISAIFCTSDRLAVHLMEKLLEKGVQIPRDLSIIGFDDSTICTHISPKLTTIRQDIPKKARISAKLLLNQICREGVASESAILPVSLVIRDTTTNSLKEKGRKL